MSTTTGMKGGGFFNDLPSNGFNQLLAKLFPPGGFVIPGVDIFPAAIGGSAFNCVVPPRILHVATIFNTIAFLEKIHPGFRSGRKHK